MNMSTTQFPGVKCHTQRKIKEEYVSEAATLDEGLREATERQPCQQTEVPSRGCHSKV